MDAQVKNTNDLTPQVGGLSVEESNQLLLIQKQILEITISGSDYQATLDTLCKLVEGLATKSVASILLLDENDECLYIRSAPNLCKEAIEDLNGLVPAENAGSCGTAVFKKEPQFVSNTINDKRWDSFHPYIKNYDVYACWSVPIINRYKKVIGSFALSSYEERVPNDFHKSILYTAVNLISLVLLREKEDHALFHAAHHDSLTQLANRTLFKIRFEHALARANRNQTTLAIYFMDLDGFKDINDQFGHDVGDKILVEVSRRLGSCIRREDSLARFGGDEFVLLVENSERELTLIADKIVTACKEPIAIKEGSFMAEFSIGISQYPKDGLILKELVRNADKAMYEAKKCKDTKYHFFSE